jgi:beta-galactosidase
MRFADKVTKRYAGHPALATFGIDNEPGDGPISYSETVRSRFIAWLKNKYGTADALNTAWAGHRWSRRIGDFADVGLPKSGTYNGAPERVLDFRRFISHEVETYLEELLDVVEANAPGALTTSNLWYYSEQRHFDYAPAAYQGRITRAGNGFYPGGGIIDNGGLRGALFGMARIQYENDTPFWCTEFTTMTAVPGSIRKSAYASLMLGNQLVCGWTWQTMHAGEEQFLQGMVDWDGRPNRKLEEYRRIAAEFAKLEGRGFPCKPRAEVAVALDFPSQIASAVFAERHDRQAQTAFEAVLDRNLDVRIVDLTRSALDYKLLIVPGVLVLDPAAAESIRAFVERGGTAIMTSYSATLNEDGQAFTTTRPGRLDDVFGIRVGSYEETTMLNELAHGRTGSERLDLEIGGRAVTAAIPRFDLVEPTTADILAHATGLDADYPLVTANRYGSGRAVYVALPARREVLDPLLESEFARLGIAGPVVPAGVMARAVDDRRVLYLNLDAEPKPIVFQGKATGVLSEARYEGGFTLGPYDAEVIELD